MDRERSGQGGRSVSQTGSPTGGAPRVVPREGDVPHSPAAERALLGAILLDSERAWSEGVRDLVKPRDFFVPGHATIYAAMLETSPADIITVAHTLGLRGVIDETDHLFGCPTEVYLVGLWRDTWAVSGCSAYARIVREHADRRLAIERGTAMVRDAYAGNKPPQRGGVRIR